MTDYISDFNIVDSGDPTTPVTFESFRYRDEVDARLARRADDLNAAIASGMIDSDYVFNRLASGLLGRGGDMSKRGDVCAIVRQAARPK